jgi:hypothetical protein
MFSGAIASDPKTVNNLFLVKIEKNYCPHSLSSNDEVWCVWFVESPYTL